MTIEELKEKVLDLENKIDTYTEEIKKEIDNLKSEYIENNCPYKVGDVYIRKSDGKKFTIYKIELLKYFYTYACPENACIIHLYNDKDGPYNLIFEYIDDFINKYATEGEIESYEERVHKESIRQSNDWLENQKWQSFVKYDELWRLGYEQAVKDLKNK